MLPLDLLERVADRAEEVVVRREHGAVEVELDHRARRGDRGHLAGEVRGLVDRLGDVGGELDDLRDGPVPVADWVVRRANPDLLPPFPDALVHARIEVAAIELRPELAVLRARPVALLDEHGVVLPLNLAERVAKRLEEVLVGRQHRAVEGEFDHRIRLVDRLDLPAQVCELLLVRLRVSALLGGSRGLRARDREVGNGAVGIAPRLLQRPAPERAGDGRQRLQQRFADRVVVGGLGTVCHVPRPEVGGDLLEPLRVVRVRHDHRDRLDQLLALRRHVDVGKERLHLGMVLEEQAVERPRQRLGARLDRIERIAQKLHAG